jgi:hypothetical protein
VIPPTSKGDGTRSMPTSADLSGRGLFTESQSTGFRSGRQTPDWAREAPSDQRTSSTAVRASDTRNPQPWVPRQGSLAQIIRQVSSPHRSRAIQKDASDAFRPYASGRVGYQWQGMAPSPFELLEFKVDADAHCRRIQQGSDRVGMPSKQTSAKRPLLRSAPIAPKSSINLFIDIRPF